MKFILLLIPEPWLTIGVVLALTAAFVAGDIRGTLEERGKCNAAAIQAQLDIARADLRISREQEASAKVLTEKLEKTMKGYEDEQRRLQEEVARRPAAAQCRLSPSDARRLR